MDRGNLEMILTHFQARARGYLLRHELRRAREDFEDIVRELDGGLSHLEWLKKVLHFPRFTDTPGASPRPSSPTNRQNPEPEPCEHCPSPLSTDHGLVDTEVDLGGLSEKLEAERDVSQTKEEVFVSGHCLDHSFLSANREEQIEGDVVDKENGGMIKNAFDSTTAWSSIDTELDCCRSVQSLPLHCWAREGPQSPEALRLHRNTLSMELLWLQQAIDSRKKYLSLKNKLNVS